MKFNFKPAVITVAVIASALTLTACTTSTPTDAPSSATKVTTQGKTITADVNNYIVSGAYGSAPEIEIKQLGNVDKMLVSDVKVGDGATVKSTDTVTVQYTGVGALSGKEFDSSWTRGGQPATFGLNQVIKGWTQGLEGMKVGGRRLLVIPASLAYGDASPTPAIKNGETLVFVVDMISNTAPTK